MEGVRAEYIVWKETSTPQSVKGPLPLAFLSLGFMRSLHSSWNSICMTCEPLLLPSHPAKAHAPSRLIRVLKTECNYTCFIFGAIFSTLMIVSSATAHIFIITTLILTSLRQESSHLFPDRKALDQSCYTARIRSPS